MNWTAALLLPKTLVLAGVCVAAAVNDRKTGKVPNRFLLISLLTGAMITLACSLAEGVWPWEENDAGPLYLLNILLAVAFAVAFYLADVWAPGDAKLFMVIVFLYPPFLQTAPDGSVFPSLQIVVWAFSSGFLYLLAEPLLSMKKSPKANSPKRAFFKESGPAILRMLMAYGFSMLTNALLASLFPVFYETNRTLCVLLVILGCYLIGKQSERVIVSVAILSGIGVVVVPAARLLFRSLSFGSLLPWSVAILMGFLSRTIRKNNYLEIVPEQLAAGMILSAYTSLRFQDRALLPSAMESRRSRLTPEQAEAVKKWATRKREPILIVKMIPFAPFIAAGTLMELLLGWLRLYR